MNESLTKIALKREKKEKKKRTCTLKKRQRKKNARYQLIGEILVREGWKERLKVMPKNYNGKS